MFRGTAMFICDIQRRILPQIFNSQTLLSNINTLISSNKEYRQIMTGQQNTTRPAIRNHYLARLGTQALSNQSVPEKTMAPIVVAEFLKDKLGKTDQTILNKMPIEHCYRHNKTDYTMYNQNLDKRLRNLGINHILLTGVQTEWCITQTALDFHDRGYDVQVIQDATGSQNEQEHEWALDRLRQQGIWVNSTHGWLVDRLSRAENPVTNWYLKLLRESKS